MRRKLVFALSVCICALWPAGCDNSSGRESLAELIPADAVVILSLNWQAVRGDGDLLKLVKGTEFKQVFGQLNVSEGEIDDLAVFGDGADGAAASAGMLLRGSFDAGDVAASLKERGWREQGYEGHEVFLSPTDGTRLAALDSDALVVGTEKGVEGAIRAASDADSAFVSTDAYQRLSRLLNTDEHPVSMMIAFPQHFQDAADTALQVSSVVMDFAGAGALGELMSKIGYSRAIGCSIGRRGDAFPLELVAVMRDEDAAALISGGLTLLKGISALADGRAAHSPKEAEAMRNFQNMSISREKDVLSIELVMSRNNLFSD